MLLLHSAAHLLVDGLCAAVIFGPVRDGGDLSLLILLYNTLAFSTQCFVGMAADRVKKHALSAAVSMLLVVCGYVLPLPAVVRICFVGIGNSVFHVAGGAVTLEDSGGRAGPLGVFVAPGAIGLTLGTLWPSLGPVFAALLAAAALAEIPVSKLRASDREGKAPSAYSAMPQRTGGELLPVLLLSAAVATRAVGGFVIGFPWKTTAALTLVTTLAVWAGKTAGGFLCDRIGPKKAALASVPAAAVLITFCSAWMLPSLIGQFALNLTMPVTLWLMYRAMPDAPGFAFGLAASALWPGTLAGKLISLTGPAAQCLTVVTFLFGLAAILWSAAVVLTCRVKPEEKGKTP